MTDALADHLLEHGVRRPPRPVMPVLAEKVTCSQRLRLPIDDGTWPGSDVQIDDATLKEYGF